MKNYVRSRQVQLLISKEPVSIVQVPAGAAAAAHVHCKNSNSVWVINHQHPKNGDLFDL